ncbi:unnamed protein product [Vitrella brassicaformis CCMP3155]|uniref:DUF423-domain-containing protein n=1 Tax=Vitrella brassicaformis (strain CCMP3155) TaxID=1169540 RepID=A0A0G4EBW5_VITBC|nr:unnamed protein product [Vitrella brassicaformis CCMP3155]|mmetsp:Transcript_43610/g.123569  ORF Transcript_43610/g.123569 Transcript_43610/m.123569 type:complete len:121 (+) Transcript_43610:77-439(+)|eukprot:CEL93150.1 unnamed protein product [Vitrella brassicaformis CCMP3155]
MSGPPSPWFYIGCGSAALSVCLGAFGAHGLRAKGISTEQLKIWETATHYHMSHSVGLIIAAQTLGRNRFNWSAALFSAGIVLFSGSLYALVLSDQKWLGAVTPVGGLAFIGAWGLLALAK